LKHNPPYHLESQLAGIFKKHLAKLHEAQIILKRKYEYIGMKTDSISDLMRDSMGELYDDFEAGLYTPQVEEELRRTYRALLTWTHNVTQRSIKSVKGIKKDRVSIAIENAMDDPAVRESLELYVKQAREMIDQLGKDYIDGVQQAAHETYMNGGSLADLTDTMTEFTQGNERRAEFWAIDQVGDASSSTAHVLQQAGGFNNYVWKTVGDNAVREVHQELEGRVFSWARGAAWTGLLAKPGAKHAGQDYRCRCSSFPTNAKAEDEP
jgi:SPP1 gp7 family putative phage head morphogenesis protein